MGLATDIAGGSHESMLRAMMHAIQASKLRWRLLDQSVKPLSFERAFYLATMGGGQFFGKVGSFLDGYELDAVVLDDAGLEASAAAFRPRAPGAHWFILPTSGTLPPNSSPAERFCKDLTTAIPDALHPGILPVFRGNGGNLDGFLLVSCAVAWYNIASKMRHGADFGAGKNRQTQMRKVADIHAHVFPEKLADKAPASISAFYGGHGGCLPPGNAAEDGVL